MVHTITSVDIGGLWGLRDVHVEFQDDVNFLIGPNGSGKTTIVDIIAATLTASRRSLYRLPFERCRISLRESEHQTTATLDVSKEKTDSGVAKVVYRVSAPPLTEREYTLQEPPPNLYLSVSDRLKSHPRERSLSDEIAELVDVQWVSVSRAAVPRAGKLEKEYETTVDVKLDEVRDRFVRYAGRLSNRSSRLVTSIIESMFESLALRPSFPVALTSLRGDLKKERETICEMFSTISWLDVERYEPHIDSLFQVLDTAATKQDDDAAFLPDEIGAIFALSRLRTLEQQWTRTQERRSKIQKPLDQFFSLLNGFFKGKRIEKNESNEISVVLLTNNDRLDLRQLSSGEKQMIILLGEALLQQGKPSIYLADEPELSLHIEWQERLVSSVRELNPNSQLIFATHSPDIVGVYEDRTIDVSKMIR
jgi:predicted ATP-dependent endonuclease of OLD family